MGPGRAAACPGVQAHDRPRRGRGRQQARPHHGQEHPGIVLVFLTIGLAFFLYLPASAAAWVLGLRAKRAVDSGAISEGRNRAATGHVLGIVGTVLGVLAVIFWIVAVLVMGTLGFFESHSGV